VLLLAAFFAFLMPGNAQEDFLTRGEVEEVRDAQEPDKRIALYVVIAQRRLDAIKAGLAANKPGAGRAAQKSLREYTAVLEAVETTLEDGRESRGLREKPLKEAEAQKAEFLKYLQSLDMEGAPGYEDYHFTLEEAIAVTEEVLANVRKGAFPEVQGREPPRLPAAPPRETRQAPPAGEEEGPPRRRRPTR